jgi:hypothetical protein
LSATGDSWRLRWTPPKDERRSRCPRPFSPCAERSATYSLCHGGTDHSRRHCTSGWRLPGQGRRRPARPPGPLMSLGANLGGRCLLYRKPSARANTLWGAPRIHGELLKLGFEVAQSTVARYMCRHSRAVPRPITQFTDVQGRELRKLHCKLERAVDIEPRLWRASPQNGNIRDTRRRLLPNWPASSPIWEFRDRRRIAKARQERAFPTLGRRYLRTRDWLAGDAVLIAPVSP